MGKFQYPRSWKFNKSFQNFFRAKFWTKYKSLKFFLFFQSLLLQFKENKKIKTDHYHQHRALLLNIYSF